MSTRHRVLPIFLALAVTTAAPSAAQRATGTGSPAQAWQASWETFVETHNTCIRDAACDKKRFLNKEVRWVGTVRSIELDKERPAVVMDMAGPSLVDQNGVGINMKNDVFVFVLNPPPSELDAWRAVAKGQRIRFLARTSEGITGSVIGFSSLAGRKMLMVNVDGGQFLERLPDGSP
jgi:hypothetical protein